MLKSRLALTALVAAATISLAACGSGGDSAPAPGKIEVDATLAAMQWTDGADGVPSLAFATPVVLTDAAARLVDTAKLQGKRNVVLDAVPRKQVGVLEYHAELADGLSVARIAVPKCATARAHVALSRLDEPGENAQERRLAATRLADQGDKLRARNLEIDAG